MKNNNSNMTTTSICIPRVESSMSRNYIEKIIYNMNIGYIERLNEFPLRNDPSHKRIIMKIRWNTNNIKTNTILSHLNEMGSVNLVYDMPWYWKICTAR
jgi:uncharacterized protein YeeX (DUF496 family)